MSNPRSRTPPSVSGPHRIAVRLLRVDMPSAVMGAPAGWARWAVLLAHVNAAAGYGEGRVGGDVGAASDVSWLLNRAGTYEQVHARFVSARALMMRALAIDEAVHGPEHPTVATTLNNLALILKDLGDAAAARPLLQRALAIDEAVHGPEHPTVATLRENLTRVGDSKHAGTRPSRRR
jgi:hypothetical protein